MTARNASSPRRPRNRPRSRRNSRCSIRSRRRAEGARSVGGRRRRAGAPSGATRPDGAGGRRVSAWRATPLDGRQLAAARRPRPLVGPAAREERAAGAASRPAGRTVSIASSTVTMPGQAALVVDDRHGQQVVAGDDLGHLVLVGQHADGDRLRDHHVRDLRVRRRPRSGRAATGRRRAGRRRR